MDVVADLPADPKSAEPVQVGERALYYPALPPPLDPHTLAAITPPVPPVDTPTLPLRVPGVGGRPPLPRRASGAWPRPAAPPSVPPLNGDWMAPRGEPAAPHPRAPARTLTFTKRPPPMPSLPSEVCTMGADCPVHAEGHQPDSQAPRTETTLTTRIRISILGSRPLPTAVVRAPIQPASGGLTPAAPPEINLNPSDTISPQEGGSSRPVGQGGS